MDPISRGYADTRPPSSAACAASKARPAGCSGWSGTRSTASTADTGLRRDEGAGVVRLGLLEEHLGHCVTEAVAHGGTDAEEKVEEASDAIGGSSDPDPVAGRGREEK
jgi:hypothetical protein